MKLLCYILSVYVLSLSALQCDDAHDILAEQEEISAQLPQELHELEADDCSPFCSCQCCHVQVAFLPHKWSSTIEEKTAFFTSHLEQPLPNSYFPFWHPPRA